MAFCTSCGAELIEGNRFCVHCGAPITPLPSISPNPTQSTEPLPQTPQNPTQSTKPLPQTPQNSAMSTEPLPQAPQKPTQSTEPLPQTPQNPSQPIENPSDDTPSPKRSKTPIYIAVGALCCIAVIAIVALAVWQPWSSPAVVSTAETTSMTTTDETPAPNPADTSSQTAVESINTTDASSQTDIESTNTKHVTLDSADDRFYINRFLSNFSEVRSLAPEMNSYNANNASAAYKTWFCFLHTALNNSRAIYINEDGPKNYYAIDFSIFERYADLFLEQPLTPSEIVSPFIYQDGVVYMQDIVEQPAGVVNAYQLTPLGHDRYEVLLHVYTKANDQNYDATDEDFYRMSAGELTSQGGFVKTNANMKAVIETRFDSDVVPYKIISYEYYYD